MVDSHHEKFEKYQMLDRLAVGGMAEVYRGKLTGERGFEKLVVVKRMLPHVAEDQEMVSHFIEEARLDALLQHDNIIHVYDFGEAEGSYFIAMEYLFGKDLHSVIEKAEQENSPIGLALSLFVISKLCEGLEYAHSLTDLHGKPLNITHRDISPQNIFLTYDGKIKIIDFGIAKTTEKATKTRFGIIKGKVAYMSPEQAEGKPLDKRSDIFSVGILLYEMVTRKDMYDGATGQMLIKAINAKYDPPEELAPDLPPQVYEIMHRALAKNPEKRYQSCAEMTADIDNCLYDLEDRPNAKLLSEYMTGLFEREYAEEKEKLSQLMKYPPEKGHTPSGTAVLDKDYLKTKIAKRKGDFKKIAQKILFEFKRLHSGSKKRVMYAVESIIVILFVLLLFLGDGSVTKEKYSQLRMGMTYSEVTDILGNDDECRVELGIKNCVWGSEGKNIKVTFIADKAISFSNKGL
ncbi:MAG: protein kinase [Desulfobacterales bacterium]|nr:protein kinase [Desulfobacterales bacterium]